MGIKFSGINRVPAIMQGLQPAVDATARGKAAQSDASRWHKAMHSTDSPAWLEGVTHPPVGMPYVTGMAARPGALTARATRAPGGHSNTLPANALNASAIELISITDGTLASHKPLLGVMREFWNQ